MNMLNKLKTLPLLGLGLNDAKLSVDLNKLANVVTLNSITSSSANISHHVAVYRNVGLLCILLSRRAYSESTRRNFVMGAFAVCTRVHANTVLMIHW